MALQSSGAISFNNINVELGVAGTTSASLNQASYRTLAGIASGTISLASFYGKSNAPAGGTISVSMIWNYSTGYGDRPEETTFSYTNVTPSATIYGNAISSLVFDYNWTQGGGTSSVVLAQVGLPRNTFNSITGPGGITKYTANATWVESYNGTLWQWGGQPGVVYVPPYGQSGYGMVSFSYT
jgi:hypothetical protein